MKILKKIGAILLSICLIAPMCGVVSYAANGRASVSGTSGRVGSTVTIRCSVTSQAGAIGAVDMVLTYDQSGLTYMGGSEGTNGGSGSVQCVASSSSTSATTLSFSLKFRIEKEGSFSVNTAAIEAYTMDEQLLSVSGARGKIIGTVATTTQPQQDTRDNNSKLGQLQFSTGTLEPEFSADITSYTLIVPDDTTSVDINAKAQSDKARVTVSGGQELRLGANMATVTVTAENGETLAYTITIMCGEAEKVDINGTQYVFDYDFTDEQIPIGFIRTKITYNERQYEGVTNANNKIQLVSLQSGETKAFYIYKEETKTFFDFVQVSLSDGKYILPLPLNTKFEQFEGNERVTITYVDEQFDAWKLDEQFAVVYVLNHDGEEMLYRYDCIDGTFQRYVEAIENDTEKQMGLRGRIFGFIEQYHLYIIVALVITVLILSIALIYFAVKKGDRHEDGEDFCAEQESRTERGDKIKGLEPKPEKPKRRHDARRRKAMKRLEKQRRNEE